MAASTLAIFWVMLAWFALLLTAAGDGAQRHSELDLFYKKVCCNSQNSKNLQVSGY